MKICGVELKGNDAIICVMSRENGLYDIPQTRVQKVSLVDAGNAEEVQHFQFTFAKLMGKFSGGPVGFKLEACIQLIKELQVEILAGSFVKKALVRSQIDIDFRDTGLKQYQEPAFDTVFAFFESDPYMK
jgi:hypothetical protein